MYSPTQHGFPRVKFEVIYWDHKGQINVDGLNEALIDVFDGKRTPYVFPAKTHGDQYAVVVISHKLTDRYAQHLFELYEREMAT